jgi:hypothetical protein
MTKDDLPNLFIIGAPKCGTTSLFQWLADHPEICPSDPKETWYFAGNELDHMDVRPNHREDDLDSYLDCFPEPGADTRFKMEGSSHYLYSEPALDFLASMDPQPKLIVLLREPAARIWSHFNYIRQRSRTPIDLEFSDYVDHILSNDRKSANDLTRDRWANYLLSNQLAFSSYKQHLESWTRRFPGENFFITTLEELAENPRDSAKQISEWVGIDKDFYGQYQFATENTARSRRAESLRRRLSGIAKLLPPSVVRPVKSALDKVLSRSRPGRTKDDEQAMARLRDYFSGTGEPLAKEYGLDVSGW